MTPSSLPQHPHTTLIAPHDFNTNPIPQNQNNRSLPPRPSRRHRPSRTATRSPRGRLPSNNRDLRRPSKLPNPSPPSHNPHQQHHVPQNPPHPDRPAPSTLPARQKVPSPTCQTSLPILLHRPHRAHLALRRRPPPRHSSLLHQRLRHPTTSRCSRQTCASDGHEAAGARGGGCGKRSFENVACGHFRYA